MIDGYLIDDYAVFGMHEGGYVAKAYSIEMPDLSNVSYTILNQTEDEIRILLRSLPQDVRMQARLTFDNNFDSALLRYYDETQQNAADDHSTAYRNATYLRFAEAADKRNSKSVLKRARVHFWFSVPLSAGEKGKAAGRFEHLLAGCEQSFHEIELNLRNALGRIGGRCIPLSGEELFIEYDRFFNPSTINISYEKAVARFRPLESIRRNCLLTAPSPVTDPGGFVMDCRYHTHIALRDLPRESFLGMTLPICSMSFSDYEITLSVNPLDCEKEIEKAESRESKLRRALEANPNGLLRAGIEVERHQIDRLTSGEVLPFAFNFLIRTWAATKVELLAQSTALSRAVSRMQGAKPYSCSLPTTARNVFEATFPGYSRAKRQPFLINTEDQIVSNFMPLAATSTGDLENAEMLFAEANGNLIGASAFSHE